MWPSRVWAPMPVPKNFKMPEFSDSGSDFGDVGGDSLFEEQPGCPVSEKPPALAPLPLDGPSASRIVLRNTFLEFVDDIDEETRNTLTRRRSTPTHRMLSPDGAKEVDMMSLASTVGSASPAFVSTWNKGRPSFNMNSTPASSESPALRCRTSPKTSPTRLVLPVGSRLAGTVEDVDVGDDLASPYTQACTTLDLAGSPKRIQYGVDEVASSSGHLDPTGSPRVIVPQHIERAQDASRHEPELGLSPPKSGRNAQYGWWGPQGVVNVASQDTGVVNGAASSQRPRPNWNVPLPPAKAEAWDRYEDLSSEAHPQPPSQAGSSGRKASTGTIGSTGKKESQSAPRDQAIDSQEEEDDGTKTTVMLQNLPSNFTRAKLMSLLDQEGFWARYNFVYLPTDFSTQASFGYAFVNLLTPEDAKTFREHFDGFTNWGTPSDKVARVSWSCANQGPQGHVERYRNSPVMHPSVPDKCKPVVLRDGIRVAFPPPNRPIRPPRVRPSKRSSLANGGEEE